MWQNTERLDDFIAHTASKIPSTSRQSLCVFTITIKHLILWKKQHYFNMPVRLFNSTITKPLWIIITIVHNVSVAKHRQYFSVSESIELSAEIIRTFRSEHFRQLLSHLIHRNSMVQTIQRRNLCANLSSRRHGIFYPNSPPIVIRTFQLMAAKVTPWLNL